MRPRPHFSWLFASAAAGAACFSLARAQAPPPVVTSSMNVHFAASDGRWAWLTPRGEETVLQIGPPGGSAQVTHKGSGWAEVALLGQDAWLLSREGSTGALLRCPAGGGSAPQEVLKGLHYPAALTAAGDRLYWVETSPPFDPGLAHIPALSAVSTLRVRENSGEVRSLGSWPTTPIDPAIYERTLKKPAQICGVSDGSVYVALTRMRSTEFYRVSPTGGSPQRIAVESGFQQGTLHQNNLYWTGPSEESMPDTRAVCLRRVGPDGKAELVTDWLPFGGTLISLPTGLYYAGLEVFRIPSRFGEPKFVDGVPQGRIVPAGQQAALISDTGSPTPVRMGR